MKKLYLLAIALMAFLLSVQAAKNSITKSALDTLSIAESVNVTFRLDMGKTAVSDSGVWVNGAWSGWSKPEQLKFDGKFYTTTVQMHPGDSITYKFVNSGRFDWMKYENPQGPCTIGGTFDRILWVPSKDLVLDPVCYNECWACTPDSVDITFVVNMSKVAVSDSGVYVNGSWSNWSKPVFMVTLGSIHQTTIRLHPGDTIQYKYMNGAPDNWRNYENPIGTCSDSLNFNNRFFIVPPISMQLEPVCYNECALCMTNELVNVTFRLDMGKTAVSDSGVWVNGAWSGWSKPEQLKYDGKFYTSTVQMHPGDSITYKFVNSGRFDWMKYENPQGPCTIGGAFDRILWVPNKDIVLDPVCYNECWACNQDSVDIIFVVNMSKVAVSDSGVFLNGSWMNWSKPVQMEEKGILHMTTVKLHPGDTIQYKYMNGAPDNWRNYENPIGSCSDSSNFNNRYFIVPSYGMTMNTVCYNECDLCYTPQKVRITFRVDMKNTVVSDSGVWVNGAWCGWSKPEKLNFDGKYYSATVEMNSGDSITYKFVNSGRFDWMKYENPQGPCTIGGAFDRILWVPLGDFVLKPVCYNECNLCLGDSDVSVFDDWNYYAANQLPTEEQWTQVNTGLGSNPSNLQVISENSQNNILVCQSDSLHLSQVTFGSAPMIYGPFTMVVRAKSDISDGHTLGGYFEINPGMTFPNVKLMLHCEGTGNRFVSLSDDNGRFYTYPIDIREWHTYWLNFDADSLRLYIDALPEPVLTEALQHPFILENWSQFTIRMLSTSTSKMVSGMLDFIAWKHGVAISPEKFASGIATKHVSASEFQLYPNPTNGQVCLAGLPDENVAVTIYDATGKLLNTLASKNSSILNINLTDKAKGLYLIQIQTTKVKETYKVQRY